MFSIDERFSWAAKRQTTRKEDKAYYLLSIFDIYLLPLYGEGDNAFWTKLGAVWPHDDGKGFNVELIALPVTGSLVIRERKESSS